jgi:hypothetical protein
MEYYDNGNKKIVYTWKRAKDKDIVGIFLKIRKNIYDKNKHLEELIEYETSRISSISASNDLDISNSDWIDKWIIYKDGKETIKAEDVDTKGYFEDSGVDK